MFMELLAGAGVKTRDGSLSLMHSLSDKTKNRPLSYSAGGMSEPRRDRAAARKDRVSGGGILLQCHKVAGGILFLHYIMEKTEQSNI